jgi:S1-C subfamily serine protease
VRGALPVIGVLVALAMVLALGQGLIDAWVFDRAGDRVEAELDDATDVALARSVLLVRTVRCNGRRTSGTAFATEIDGTTVLVTNRHVVEGAATVGLRSLTGDPAPRVASWRLARTADVATLAVTDATGLPPALPLAVGPTEAGTEVRTVGFPAALPFTSAGAVVEVTRTRLTTNVRTDPGASGSPLLDTDGVVVGQIFARSDADLGVATTAPALRGAIEQLEDPVSSC